MHRERAEGAHVSNSELAQTPLVAGDGRRVRQCREQQPTKRLGVLSDVTRIADALEIGCGGARIDFVE